MQIDEANEGDKQAEGFPRAGQELSRGALSAGKKRQGCDGKKAIDTECKMRQEQELREQIRRTIKNCRGIRTDFLMNSNAAFEAIVKHKVKLIRNPSQQFVDLVMNELYGVVAKALEKVCYCLKSHSNLC